MFSMNRFEGLLPQQKRQFSTGPASKPLFNTFNTMPSSAGFLNNFNVEDIAANRKFGNPNFINQYNQNIHSCPPKLNLPHCHQLVEICSEFTVKTDSSSMPLNVSPNLARDMLFNADKTVMKENTQRKKEHRKTPHGHKSKHHSPQNEHKNKINMDLKYGIDEIGIDVLSNAFESDSTDSTPTDDVRVPPVFIHEALPECEISTEIYNISSSPICITIGAPKTVLLSINTESINRRRIPSDCCSEDSFIVFQCDAEDDDDDDDDEVDSSDCESETASEDEYSESSCSDDEDIHRKTDKENSKDTGRFMKKVTFADDLTKVHPMIKWSYAYQAARKGPWEEYARDRGRFKDRISKLSTIVSPVLQPDHRQKIYRERYQ